MYRLFVPQSSPGASCRTLAAGCPIRLRKSSDAVFLHKRKDILLIYNQLICNGYQTFYWQSERGAEVDFIIQRERRIIPIEVKSADNTKAKSRSIYRKAHTPAYAIKVAVRNFSKFLDLFDGVFVLEINAETLKNRLDKRQNGEWGSKPKERELIERLHQTKEDIPRTGIVINATLSVEKVVNKIIDSIKEMKYKSEFGAVE